MDNNVKNRGIELVKDYKSGSIRLRKIIKSRMICFLMVVMLLNISQAYAAHEKPAVIATIPVGSAPGGIDVNMVTNRIYVGNYFSGTISVIDGDTNSVISTIPVNPRPLGVTVNPVTNRIYVTHDASGLPGQNTVSVIDGASNSVVASIPVGRGPQDVAINTTVNRIYVVHDIDSFISVIDGTADTVISTIPGIALSLGVAIDQNTNRIYVGDYVNGELFVIDETTNTVVTAISLGTLRGPWAVATNPTINRVYVTNDNFAVNGTVSVIDSGTNSIVKTITVGKRPLGVAVNTNTNRVYVTHVDSNDIYVIDGITNTIVNIIPSGGSGTLGVTVNKETDRVYTANFFSNTVSVIADDLIAPTWPTGSTLMVSNIGITSLTLSWTQAQDNFRIMRYQIYKDGNFLAAVPAINLAYNVIGLIADTQYTFKVEACDAADNCSTDGPSVTVKTFTPQQAMQQLIVKVDNLVNTGVLNQGQGNSLIVKLEEAIKQLDQGNLNATISSLQTFIKEVNALIKAGVLTVPQGQLLISSAQEIINVLSN